MDQTPSVLIARKKITRDMDPGWTGISAKVSNRGLVLYMVKGRCGAEALKPLAKAGGTLIKQPLRRESSDSLITHIWADTRPLRSMAGGWQEIDALAPGIENTVRFPGWKLMVLRWPAVRSDAYGKALR